MFVEEQGLFVDVVRLIAEFLDLIGNRDILCARGNSAGGEQATTANAIGADVLCLVGRASRRRERGEETIGCWRERPDRVTTLIILKAGHVVLGSRAQKTVCSFVLQVVWRVLTTFLLEAINADQI